VATWRATALDDLAWRCPPGLSAAERAEEQDRAAGGREKRVITLRNRASVASVALRRKHDGRRVYAYLRWADGDRTTERYVGEVDRPTRAENLAQAWRLAAAARQSPGADAAASLRAPDKGHARQ
jgi:DNA mismatch endonuclease (patch repair protein)